MRIKEAQLIEKYDKPVPRYTSYPTVPDWSTDTFIVSDYLDKFSNSFQSNKEEGISLYIHLPYCEGLCTYCGCNTHITVNHQVEYPYIQAVLKEWKMYVDLMGERPLLREIHLGGGTPTFFSASSLKSLIKGVVQTVDLAQDYEFSFEGHPNNTTLEHLKALYELGFSRVSFGVQDFDIKVQKAINRIQSFEQVKRVNDWSREVGYSSVNFDLIYGLPFQNQNSILNTMRAMNTLMPDRVAYYSYAHVPWKRPGQRAYKETDLPSSSLKRSLNKVGQECLLHMGYVPIGMDHFSLPGDRLIRAHQQGKLHRNFMGYTVNPGKLLIGLGVSSISDIDLAYSQNAKSVAGYLKLLEKDRLPIVKGHIMSDQERVTKSKVLSIFCDKRIQTKDAAKLYQECRSELEELVADGLLVKTSNGFDVTTIGLQFLRNISTLFDPNYKGNQNVKVFSQSI